MSSFKISIGNYCRIIVMALWILPMGLFSQTTLYDLGQIQKIEIQFSQPNWDYRLDTAKHGQEEYLMSDWVKINGIQYDSAGVKYKGNSSFDSTRIKNPFHIALDEFKNQSHEGITDLKLGNGYADPSLIREALAYDILQNYMHCPRSNFAQIYVNGQYLGLYSNSESINKDFCSDHFNSSRGSFFKCSPINSPSPITKSNLQFLTGQDSTGYFPRYELKSNQGWNDLVNLCDVATNTPATLANSIDVDRVIWMLAFNNLLVNLDSYSGVFAQNYYLYRDQTNHFNPIIWDLNMCFGGFPFSGGGPTGMGTMTVPQLEQFALDFHSTDPFWPLINDIMADPRSKRKYIAHIRTMADEMIASNSYITKATSFQSLIDTAVASDIHKYYTYAEFQNGMTGDAMNGSFTVPGISSLMSARLAYLQATPEFNFVPPVIASALPNPAAPALNSTLTITSQVSGADSVFLGYRLNASDKFSSTIMYDDGNHGDGGANDGLYGAEFILTTAEAQYYVYAENSDAGAFSPARAEHEFHTVQAALSFPNPGELVINEFLAQNQTDEADEAGQFEDWIELYNNSGSALSLAGFYLSDDFLNLTKYDFPTDAVIPPHGFLMIWADEDPSTSSYLHCNFKLSSQGEAIYLSNNNGLVFDSVLFGPQVLDVSVGRCPDGTGAFAAQASTTFNALNCSVAAEDIQNPSPELNIYPSPANTILHITSNQRFKGELQIWDAFGRMIQSESWDQKADLDVHDWPAGLYFVQLGTAREKVLVVH